MAKDKLPPFRPLSSHLLSLVLIITSHHIEKTDAGLNGLYQSINQSIHPSIFISGSEPIEQ